MADNHYDVIIIGTGAGGGTLAYRLAPSGKRILLLERGGYVPRDKQLVYDLTRIGHRPFHMPVGVMLDEQNPRQSRCIRCDTCDGFPCFVYAKADAQVICVDPALTHPNVTLVTDAYVARLETSASGREVRKVHVERTGARETYSAGVVVVSCGAINSAALLLRSASEQHPRGLANGSDVVGRHYMCHLNSMLLAVSREP